MKSDQHDEDCRYMKFIVSKNMSGKSAKMLSVFINDVISKFTAAEEKHKWKDRWAELEESDRLAFMKQFHEHIRKGDPRDCAIYLAIMHYYGWKTEGEQHGAK